MNSRRHASQSEFPNRPSPNLFKASLRFLVAGAAATLLNLFLLWLLSAGFRLWYLTASVIAFSIALICNFAVQKLWAFQSMQFGTAGTQLLHFIGVNLFTLALNTAILYSLVERMGISYLLAQIVSSAVISGISYGAYRHIFRPAQASVRS